MSKNCICRRWSSRLLTVAFVVILTPAIRCSAQTSSSNLAVSQKEGVIGDSVSGFSDKQGKNGWYYGYWDRSKDGDGKYAQSDFRLLENFGADARNGLKGHDAFTTGDLWFLDDGRSYTSIWATGGHANSSEKLGSYAAAEQWAVRRWISHTSGMVTLSGHIGKVMPWGANWGGECKATILVDGEVVLSSVMDNQGLDYSVAVKIRDKSVVDFLIAPNPSIGVVTFTATIRERPISP